MRTDGPTTAPAEPPHIDYTSVFPAGMRAMVGLQRAVDGEPGCRRALADAGRHIGAAVADLCNLINPERIVVGGSMAVAGDVLLDPLREAVGLRAIPSAAEDVQIVPGELEGRAPSCSARWRSCSAVPPGADRHRRSGSRKRRQR